MVVLDACGVGALEDSERYGDAGANTLGHLARAAGGLRCRRSGGSGSARSSSSTGCRRREHPVLHGRLHALGPGKDSTAGHWELMGVVMDGPLPTYPDGFPAEVVALITAASGRGVLCNRPYNGIEAIEHFGAEHVRTGELIVYTSQDSVLQIAAHVDVVAPERAVRDLQPGARRAARASTRSGRVIARPFAGATGRLRAHRRPARLLAGAAGPQLPRRAAGRRGPGSHRRQGGPAVRGRRDRRAASRRDQPPGAGGDRRAAPRARAQGSCSRT